MKKFKEEIHQVTNDGVRMFWESLQIHIAVLVDSQNKEPEILKKIKQLRALSEMCELSDFFFRRLPKGEYRLNGYKLKKSRRA